MAEGIQEIGREFVKKTIEFIDGSFGFHNFMDSYTAPGAVSIPVGNENITFDILMYQDTWTAENPPKPTRKYFYAECKKRENSAQLKGELKAFLINVLKVTPHLPGGYQNCDFIFFHNKGFSVTQEKLHSIEFVMDLLDNAYSIGDIQALCGRVGIICLDDWFLKLTASGRQQ
jgi:hypothetical protein